MHGLLGKYAGHPELGAADYKLVHHAKNGRAVYSFCMCPGGWIVPAAIVSLGLAAAVGVAVGPQRTAAASPEPATFRVGAAVASIDPDPGVPLYSGGFGYSPPVTQQYAPLEVRAFYVSNGRHAAAIAVVDSQAYFAAYQEKDQYGQEYGE